MATGNGDLINSRIQDFRNEIESKYPKLKNTDSLNAALDLTRLVVSTFTRDSHVRLSSIEHELCRYKQIFKWFMSFLTAILVGILTTILMRIV
jgi:hypothetical protein